MAKRMRCDVCDVLIPPHAHYVVRIDVFADPEMPEIDTDELKEMDFDATFARLVEQMKHMTDQELQDQVHKRIECTLCPRCQREFLANPLGKPRGRRESRN